MMSLQALIPVALFVCLVSCDASSKNKIGKPINAPPSAHPAMNSVMVNSGNSQVNSQGHGNLPAGHPPIDTSASSTTQPSQRTPSPGGSSEAATASDGSDTLDVGNLTFTISEGLVQEKPSSRMRVAQFRLPRTEGDPEDGVMTVIPARGSLDDNITRWSKQFKENPSDGRQVHDVAGMKVTTVRMEGTFQASMGPFSGGGTPKKDFRLWGAIFATQDGGSLFFKAIGPKATVRTYEERLEAMARSVRSR